MQHRRSTIGAVILIAAFYVYATPSSGASYTASQPGTITITFEVPPVPAVATTQEVPAKPELEAAPEPVQGSGDAVEDVVEVPTEVIVAPPAQPVPSAEPMPAPAPAPAPTPAPTPAPVEEVIPSPAPEAAPVEAVAEPLVQPEALVAPAPEVEFVPAEEIPQPEIVSVTPEEGLVTSEEISE